MALGIARAWTGLKARWSGPSGSTPALTHLWDGVIPVINVGFDGPDHGALNWLTWSWILPNANQPMFEFRGGDKGATLWCLNVVGTAAFANPQWQLSTRVHPSQAIAQAATPPSLLRDFQSASWWNGFLPAGPVPLGAQIEIPSGVSTYEIQFPRPILLAPNETFVGQVFGVDLLAAQVMRGLMCFEEGF